MVSNKNRKTKYNKIDLPVYIIEQFKSCKTGKEKNPKTMQKLIDAYKSKCLNQEGPGVITAD